MSRAEIKCLDCKHINSGRGKDTMCNGCSRNYPLLWQPYFQCTHCRSAITNGKGYKYKGEIFCSEECIHDDIYNDIDLVELNKEDCE